MYNLNLNTLASDLMPAALRMPRLLGFARLCLWAAELTLSSLRTLRSDMTREGNCRFGLLELSKALNDAFPQANENISITNQDEVMQRSFSYLKSEAQPHPGFNYLEYEDDTQGYIYLNSELANTPDFIVEVPNLGTIPEQQVKSIVHRYRVAGKRFRVDYV